MEDKSTIRDLAFKYWKGELSAEEKSELLTWASISPENARWLQHFDNVEKVIQGAIELQIAKQLDWQRIIAQAPELQGRKLRLWPRIASAAAAIMILVLSGYCFYSCYPSKEIVEPSQLKLTQSTPEILPNTETATITLNDGTIIPVDSVGNLVAGQGTTEIRKNDGLLVYQAIGDSDRVCVNTAQTKGKRLSLKLVDGTFVILNAATKLEYPTKFTGDFREVILLEGEAYFDVAHNDDYPFHVKIKSNGLTVTGTQFAVKAYSNEQTEIFSELFQGGLTARSYKDSIKFDLKPGYQFHFDSTRQTTLIEKNADVADALAWLNDYIKLKDASIEQIMRVLGRHYDIAVIYNSKITATFNGKLPTNVPLSNVLKMLESTHNVRFKIDGKVITIISGA
jgi:transmembrane sensor